MRRDGRRGNVEERTNDGWNKIEHVTPETIVGQVVIISWEITKATNWYSVELHTGPKCIEETIQTI